MNLFSLKKVRNSWCEFREGPLPRYYLYGFLPVIVFHLLIFLMGVHLLNLALSALGFLWPYSVMAPGIQERVQARQYRYSFLRFSIRFYWFVRQRLPLRPNSWMNSIAYLSFPLLFGFLLGGIAPLVNPAFALIGWALWHIFLETDKKLKLELLSPFSDNAKKTDDNMSGLIPISLGFIVCNVSETGFSLWMQKRNEEGPLDGLWEVPGGKWKPHESPEDACRREVLEETGVDIGKWVLFQIYPFQYRDRNLSFNAYLTREAELPEGPHQRWFLISFDKPLRGLEDLIPAANKKMLEELAFYIKETFEQGDWEALWQPSLC